jgi:two-component system, chemotaxis family, protein-glutamate methylesterase/glutaminase
MAASAAIRVLIVDDSATIRAILARKLEEGGFEVVGRAADGIDALEQIERLRPDVVTMDVEMPRLDGLQTLERLMRERPTPVVMVSSLTRAGAEVTLRALDLGAVDFAEKPTRNGIIVAHLIEGLVQKVRVAATARVTGRAAPSSAMQPRPARLARQRSAGWAKRIVMIGASTGGPQALRQLIGALPEDLGVPVVVVQHMPEGFTTLLANRLDALSPIRVAEAREGDALEPGRALVAPGGKHLLFDADGVAHLGDGPQECGVRPCINVTVESLLGVRGWGVLGVVLTGMGNDGTRGAALLRAARADVIAESAETALIYGMPRSVHEAGYATTVLPLHAIAEAIVSRCAINSPVAA